MKMSNNRMLILEIISVIIGITLIPLSNTKIRYAIGFGLFFAGGYGLIMRLMNKLKKKKQKI